MGGLVADQTREMSTQLTTTWLGKGVAKALFMETTRSAPLETGGVLLGWRTTEHICVTDIVGPGPGASHARDSFVPDAEWQSEEVARLYAESGRRLAYLGDWHTHPGGTSNPSLRDQQTLSAIARHAPARCPQPIMIILGQHHGDEWTASCHLITNGHNERKRRLMSVPLQIDEEIEGFTEPAPHSPGMNKPVQDASENLYATETARMSPETTGPIETIGRDRSGSGYRHQ